TNDVGSWNEAPITAIVGIVAIIPHHKIGVRRNVKRPGIFLRRVGIRQRIEIGLIQLLAVHEHNAAFYFDRVARQADDALNEIFVIGGLRRRFENDDLLALGIAPKRDVVFSEGNADVVPHQGHDQMIADQYRVFHGRAGNHTRLNDHGFENEEREYDPKPGKQFAANQFLGGELGLLGLLLFLPRFRASFRFGGRHSSADLKTVEDAVPANFAGMDENAQI